MKDLTMILMIGGTFLLFYGFMSWCGKVIQDPEGDAK